MQSDLLKFAVDRAFLDDPNLRSIKAESSCLTAYISNSFLKAGFHISDMGGKFGILNWSVTVYELSRESWNLTFL